MTEEELAAWLRALPMLTILVDDAFCAWQLRDYIDVDDKGEIKGVVRAAYVIASSGDEPFLLDDDEDMASIIESAPFTVVYMPPVGMPAGGEY